MNSITETATKINNKRC